MSAENPPGRCFIWFISLFLFLSIVSGGAFLVLYMTRPETPTTSWYPIVGIGLVCMPWSFWILTFLYRILSRTFGFRMVCWGTDVYPVDSVHIDRGRMENGNTDASNQHGNGTMAEEGQNKSSPRDSHESEMPLKLSMAS